MRIQTLALGIAAAAASAQLGAQTKTSEFETVSGATQVDGTTQTDDVKLKRDDHDRMTVPVRLDGNGPYRFLVDTGADRTAISKELATRLKLRTGSRAKLHSVTGESSVETANIQSLQLSQKEMRDIDAPLLEAGNMGADGILGVDSLRSQRVLFDFKARTMSIVPSAKKYIPEEEGTIVVQAKERNGRLVLTDARADGQKVAVVLDTGSQLSIGNEALRRQLIRGRVLRNSGKVDLISVTGATLTGDYMFLDKLEIGGVGLKNLAIVFAEAHTFRQIGLEDKPALLLGMNAMRGFERVSIDFARRKLRVVVPETGAIDGARMAIEQYEALRRMEGLRN